MQKGERAVRILLVEDDMELCRLMGFWLEEKGYLADICQDSQEAFYYLGMQAYNVVILDRMLPGMDGIQSLQRMRQKGIATPVIMVTALGTIEDRIGGLDAGADDYLVKPFEFEELLARLRALLRRQQRELVSQKIDLGEIVLDLTKKAVLKDDQVLDLTAKEYEVLEYLARNQDHILSREQIRDHVWDFDYEGESNIIDVLIKNIRRKIDQDKKQSIIHTKRGVGYVIWSSE